MTDPRDYADFYDSQDDGEDQYDRERDYAEYANWDEDYLEDWSDPTDF